MSTRWIVAKPDGDAWRGRYGHSDGYPTGVGEALFIAYHGTFGGDLDAMVTKLVDDEHVGWSSICGHDLSLPPEWREYDAYPRLPAAEPGGYEPIDYSGIGPQSYTARGETPFNNEDGTGDWLTPDQTNDTEWFYVLSPGGLVVGKCRFDKAQADPVGFIPWATDPAQASAQLDQIEKSVYADDE